MDDISVLTRLDDTPAQRKIPCVCFDLVLYELSLCYSKRKWNVIFKFWPFTLGGAVVARSPLTAMAWVRLQLQAACGMSFTLHSQCLVVFPLFSSTLRNARNCSDWNRLIRLTVLARTCSGWRKINGFIFYCKIQKKKLMCYLYQFHLALISVLRPTHTKRNWTRMRKRSMNNRNQRKQFQTSVTSVI